MRVACLLALALRIAPLLRAQAHVETARQDVLVLARHTVVDVCAVGRVAAATVRLDALLTLHSSPTYLITDSSTPWCWLAGSCALPWVLWILTSGHRSWTRGRQEVSGYHAAVDPPLMPCCPVVIMLLHVPCYCRLLVTKCC